MVRTRTTSPRPAWSALSVLAVLFTAWAAAAVAAAMGAAERLTRLRDFSGSEVLAASWPYAAALLPLLAVLSVAAARRGAWAREPQVVKLGIIVALLAGATAWLMIAYPAVISEFGASGAKVPSPLASLQRGQYDRSL